MSVDHPSSVEAGQESISPEVADYFQVATPPAAAAEKVASIDKEDKKVDAEKSKEKPSEGKADDKSKSDDKSKATEEKKTTDTKTPPGEDESKKDDTQPVEYEVAGKKFKSLEKAIEAVNRISGNNTKLVGEKRELQDQKVELEDKVKTLSDRLAMVEEANQKWQEYYDGEGERPENKIDLATVVEETLTSREKKKAEKERASNYEKELDEIFLEEDFSNVQPFFKELIDEYEGAPKASPKKLYERARREYKASKGEAPEDPDLKSEIEKGVQRELAKREASRSISASGGSSKTPDPSSISPEIADYFKNR